MLLAPAAAFMRCRQRRAFLDTAATQFMLPNSRSGPSNNDRDRYAHPFTLKGLSHHVGLLGTGR